MVRSTLSHVALLVPSVEKAAGVLRQRGYAVQELEVFSGTREIYVGEYGKNSALLLLMEPAREDSDYGLALKKRGPGVHHIALDTLHIENYLQSIERSGWFLHLNSFRQYKNLKTVYLARPQMPTLIELQEKAEEPVLPPLVTEISLPLDDSQLQMIKKLNLEQVRSSSQMSLRLYQENILLSDLL